MKKWSLFALIIMLFACSEYNYYDQVKIELDKNIRNDSLFYGYYFGMPRQDFYDHSWEMNKKKHFTQGEYNQSIQYQVNDGKSIIRINFFPQFLNEEIGHMTVVYSYPAWSPWSKEFWSDKLILKVKDLIEKEENIKFELIKDKNGTPGFVNVTGNKRILITIKGDEQVVVLYTDMTTLENPRDSLILNKKYE